ncbi:MAG: peptide-methionine (S)-S-oxide reductase [Gammaproteobacteria bacterium]|nr:MAG: peptide-methionine (S)-S-oxide reductase [Gammaproteobacteria bacterium]
MLDMAPAQLQTATFGAGCYWCVEAVFEQLDGVTDVTSGFMGGADDEATYRQVCSGTTGHAEVVQLTFDPKVLPYAELLDWFWRLHDPTTLNRQGADVGTQYRSVIFFHSPEQERIARLSKDTLGERAEFEDPVVTEISAASKLIGGPDDHQDYYQANKTGRYCQMVIAPKLRKLGLKD